MTIATTPETEKFLIKSYFGELSVTTRCKTMISYRTKFIFRRNFSVSTLYVVHEMSNKMVLKMERGVFV